MKCANLQIVVVLVIVCFFYGAECDLAVTGPRCGNINCQIQEFCSNFDNRCHPCTEVCNQSTHNYDASLCAKSCQDYLHDVRYARIDGGSAGNEDLRAVVQRLQYMVTVSLTLTCLVLVALITIAAIQVCKWKTDNNITFANFCSKIRSKKSNSNANKSSGNGVTAGQVSGKPDLRLDMPTTGTQSEHSPATLTTSISRRPAEDSALDYAYDNHAMSSSPSPNSKPHESNF